MSAVSDYYARVKPHYDSMAQSVDGLVGDVAGMKDLITQLQNNPGPISVEDQALLDQLEALIGTHATSLKALDDATAPATLPVP